MPVTYLVPVILVGVAIYFVWLRMNQSRQLAAGRGAIMFHNMFAEYFSSLGRDEYIIAVWQGLAYTGPESLASQVGRGLLNSMSSSAIGFSSYTPLVFVAVTSQGRVLVAQEYSYAGKRDNYKDVAQWASGSAAVRGAEAISGDPGRAPKNPLAPTETLEFVVLQGGNAPDYPCWLPSLGLDVAGKRVRIGQALPLSSEAAAQMWNTAEARARTPARSHAR